MDFGMRDKVALVTGGNRGLGLEIGRTLAREGVRVMICGRNVEALTRAEQELRALGGEAAHVVADLFEATDCIRVVNATVDRFGALDIVINNASTDVAGYPSRLEEVTDEQLMERVNGKTLGAIRCCRAALPYLRASGAGRVVNIGGDAARTTSNPFTQGHGSALAAGLGNAMLVNFTKRFSNEVAPDGIVANVVHPGAALVGERFDKRVRTVASRDGVDVATAERTLTSRVPIGRGIRPDDIAPLVVFLASPLAAGITGQSIAVDGGASPTIVY